MHLSSLLDIAADALADRVAVAASAGGTGAGIGAELTYKELSERVAAVSRHLASVGAERLRRWLDRGGQVPQLAGRWRHCR